MLLDLKFSIGTLGIGAGTFIAALYGMNLKSFIEESDFGFPIVYLFRLLSIQACAKPRQAPRPLTAAAFPPATAPSAHPVRDNRQDARRGYTCEIL